MPTRRQLAEEAEALGLDVPANRAKGRITEAIQAADVTTAAPPQALPASTGGQPLDFAGKRLVEFKRHRIGPPRRSPGQRAWLTGPGAKREGLIDDDAEVVTRGR